MATITAGDFRNGVTFEMEGMDIFLGAPTGRAAKRMSETTGFEARTIHRMLEVNGGVEGTGGFERNEKNPLETDVIIIDEMSMVDITLMYALLKAVLAGTRLILVGDVNQLPSVGPGAVLKDIIDSQQFHTVKLNKIFRQASTSDIIVNAHKINNGEEVVLDNKSMDFFFLKRYEADKIIQVTLQLIKQKLPKFVDASEYDIQVLTPTRKGLLGVERLNNILQMYLNPEDPSKREKEYGTTIFREGDKVIFTFGADGFLYNMVRIMTGTLLYIAAGKIAPESIPAIIESKDRLQAGITVPGDGLYLNRIYY